MCAEHKKPAKLLKHLKAVQEAAAGQRHKPQVLVFANRIKVGACSSYQSTTCSHAQPACGFASCTLRVCQDNMAAEIGTTCWFSSRLPRYGLLLMLLRAVLLLADCALHSHHAAAGRVSRRHAAWPAQPGGAQCSTAGIQERQGAGEVKLVVNLTTKAFNSLTPQASLEFTQNIKSPASSTLLPADVCKEPLRACAVCTPHVPPARRELSCSRLLPFMWSGFAVAFCRSFMSACSPCSCCAQVLVASDVAARGLDIHGLPYVVNYDFPGNLDTYIHRVGRTGRLGAHGQAYSFLTRNLVRNKTKAVCLRL